jgi:hypothetical protein
MQLEIKRPDSKCSSCKGSGTLIRKPEPLGYRRRPDLDDKERVGWMTPSGLKMMVLKEEELVIGTMCDCVRRQMRIQYVNIKLVADIRS